MTIKQVQLANTFDVWRVATNQLITISNDLTEGNLATSGTISLDNPSGFLDNVSLNVKTGMIYGDGGLLSNVGKPSSITNQKLQNSSITVVTQKQVVLSSGTIQLGDTVYLNVANLVTVNTDTSVSNIASANLVNSVHVIATRADLNSNAAYIRANSVNTAMISAFGLANTTNTNLFSACSAITSLTTTTVQLNINTTAAFVQSNNANLLAQYATGHANLAFNQANNANLLARYAAGQANLSFNQANLAFNQANLSFNQANLAFNQANNANLLAQYATGRSNASVNTIASSTNTSTGWSVHNSVSTAGRRTLNFRDSGSILITVADDSTLGIANVTFVANAVLPNTSTQAGSTFRGNLTVTGIVADQFGNVRQAIVSNRTNPVVLTKSDVANTVFMGAGNPLGGGASSNTYIPPGVFVPGDVIRLWNNTVGAQTIIAKDVSFYVAGNTSLSFPRTGAGSFYNLSGYGVATLTCIGTDTFVYNVLAGNTA